MKKSIVFFALFMSALAYAQVPITVPKNSSMTLDKSILEAKTFTISDLVMEDSSALFIKQGTLMTNIVIEDAKIGSGCLIIGSGSNNSGIQKPAKPGADVNVNPGDPGYDGEQGLKGVTGGNGTNITLDINFSSLACIIHESS